MFKAFAQGVQVNGETVLSVVDGMGLFRRRAFEILAAHGITDPAPGRWYAQQGWLDAFKEISESVGQQTLYAIGKKIPEHAVFPPEIKGIQDALSSINLAYHMNHKDGEIGEYKAEKEGERGMRLVCRNPYPCNFDRGIIKAMAERFKPSQASTPIVRHDEQGPCREKGDDTCVYHVSW